MEPENFRQTLGSYSYLVRSGPTQDMRTQLLPIVFEPKRRLISTTIVPHLSCGTLLVPSVAFVDTE